LSEQSKTASAERSAVDRLRAACLLNGQTWWVWNAITGEASFSPEWCAFVGLEEESAYGFDAWIARVHPDDLDHVRRVFGAAELARTARFDVRHRMCLADGSTVWVHTRAIVCASGTGDAAEWMVLQTELPLWYGENDGTTGAELHDSVIGLPSRGLFLEHLSHTLLKYSRASGVSFAVIMVDLDRFALINSSLGQSAGDLLLRTVATRIVDVLRPADIVARIGSDEFGLLVEDLNDGSDALRVARRISETFSEAVNLDGQEVFVSSCIGVALGATHYQEANEVMRDAGTALKQAKKNGENAIVLFDQAMYQQAVSRLSVENDLHRGIERNELVLHYQPIISMNDRSLHGLEALVRWNHPERGHLSPAAFLPVAELSDLIRMLGRKVLEMTCEQIALWVEAGHADRLPPISVNISGRQFVHADFVDEVEAVFRRTNVDPSRVAFEVTEGVLMDNCDLVASILARLKRMGVHIMLDDFGTGYSSLSYLQKLPIDSLKIDRCFVRQMEEDQGSAEIIRSVVSLAHNLSLVVVAEGVETPAQESRLRDLGCDFAQGFLFARPAPSEEIEVWLTPTVAAKAF